MNFYNLDHKVTKEDLQKLNFENKRIGVIVHIEDDSGKILLQQRGLKARDENGFYEDVGGSVENEDIDYNAAIIREMKEEMGNDVKIELSDSTSIYHIHKNNTNWVFAIFKGKYIGGNINIMEPEKCTGYKFFSYEEIMNSDLVSEGCKFLTKSIKNSKK